MGGVRTQFARKTKHIFVFDKKNEQIHKLSIKYLSTEESYLK